MSFGSSGVQTDPGLPVFIRVPIRYVTVFMKQHIKL
jgi:hypothetical protein